MFRPITICLTFITALVAPTLAQSAPSGAPAVARSSDFATLRDSTIWPESAAYDSASGRLYVASVKHRTVYVKSADGAERPLWDGDAHGEGAIMGLRLDARRGALWATTSWLPQLVADGVDSSASFVLRLELATGRITRRLAAPDAARPPVLGDIAVDTSGDVYATDSRNGAIYRWRAGARIADRLAHPLFRSLQGITVGPGGVLFVADYQHGILAVRFDAGIVDRMGPADRAPDRGIDGIAWHARSRSIIAVQNGTRQPRIVQLLLDAEGRDIQDLRVLDQRPDVADEPTNGFVLGDHFIYVANSQWEKYTESGTRRPGTTLLPPRLLMVAIP